MRISDQNFRSSNTKFSRVDSPREPKKIAELTGANFRQSRLLSFGVGAGVMTVIIIGVLAALGVFNPIADLTAGVESNDAEIAELLSNVGDNPLQQVFDLQSAEPIVATVIDPELMRGEDPTFYSEAQEGDKVIILNQKRLIILYRESEDRIINIASGTLAVTNP